MFMGVSVSILSLPQSSHVTTTNKKVVGDNYFIINCCLMSYLNAVGWWAIMFFHTPFKSNGTAPRHMITYFYMFLPLNGSNFKIPSL